ncbi:MAG TPA: hypothetical protein VIK33_17565 [Anaerolineae bacterium]
MNFADFQEAVLIVAGTAIADLAVFALAGTILLAALLIVLGLARRMLNRNL